MSLLLAQGLCKSFGETHAVDGVDFHIEGEEIVSLVGSNGAGKTTLVNLLSGLLLPDAGRITFGDGDITALPVGDRIRAGIARSFQLVNLFDQLSVLDNVRLTIFSRDGATRQPLRLAERDTRTKSEAMEILRAFGLESKWEVPAAGLAQGERKLLDVAVAYALRPKVILLDEPTSGVGTREKGMIMDVIAQVVRERFLSAVIVEHDMDIVFTYSARIVMMHQGKVLAEGTPEQIRADERVATALLGKV
jgi:branched-chain amino acid transport system ATP-binding protein